MNSPTVLVIDSNQPSLDFMRMLLSAERFNLYTAHDLTTARRTFQQVQPRLVFLDPSLANEDGSALLGEFLDRDPSIAVILVTGENSIETAVRSIQMGAFDYFSKPIDLARLKVRVDAWMEIERERADSADLKSKRSATAKLAGMVGRSQSMVDLFSRVRRAAPHFSAALVTGDSGTGKELVARALHSLSGRTGPFVVCNCSAVPETLFESQLFGHVKGSYTGAGRDEKGFVAAAEDGTLFLDEIGELPLSLQPKLLRLLQNGEIQRVGAPTVVQSNARVVAATNRDLMESVKNRTFREDLYYRLAMIQFRVPSLRNRMQDFPVLIRHFLDTYGVQFSKPSLTLSLRAERALQQHSWPGNVRELQNVLAYACMMAESATIEVSDFPEWWVDTLRTRPARSGIAELRDLERDHILQVLQACDGNRTQAAKALGIGRATLYRVLARQESQAADHHDELSGAPIPMKI